MPKQTFFNLKESKRHKVIDAALDEFANHALSDASVNRIIKHSGIAVGSFYQYFEDITDLFLYIFELLAKQKYEFIDAELRTRENDEIEATLKAAYCGAMKFALSDKRHIKISYHFLNISKRTLLNTIHQMNAYKNIENTLETVIARAIDNGELRKHLSAQLIVKMMTNINMLMINQLFSEKKTLTEADFHRISDTVIDVLMNGIKIAND